MESPKIRFSKWVKWDNREVLEDSDYPGVYLLAHFDIMPNEPADPITEQIIYIGETCNQNLQKRWYQFNRSAFEGKFGHSGGATYRGKFGDRGETLYVAAYPVKELNKHLRSFFIRYVERKLIWDFILRYGSVPLCNRK
jgi:hypothetical protein